MSTKSAPLLVSFHSGAAYYHEAAAQLRDDCARHGVDCDIRELAAAPGEDWAAICRRKLPFLQAMMREHQRPLLWVDADCRLLRAPALMDIGAADFAAFLRGFRYLRGFDPLQMPRLFQPSILFFNDTPRGRAFLDYTASLEAASPVRGTDDYFLQEAWSRFEPQLAVTLLPPELVALELPAAPQACFLFGRSGQVSQFKGSVAQHEPEIYSPQRRKAMLLREAALAVKDRQLDDARFFLTKAYAVDPTDDQLALRIARALRRAGKLAAALMFLRRHRGQDPRANHARRFQADTALDAGNLERAAALVDILLANGSDSDRAWAASRSMRIGMEQRARALGLTEAERPALWWMEGPYPGNLGDILGPYVVEKLSGLPPRLAPKGKGLLAIGSVARFAREGTLVWGAGIPRLSDRLDPKARYLAVRGPLTRLQVLEGGGECPEVYGDPAWFLPLLYRPAPRKPQYRLGLVRHHAHDAELAVAPDVKLISVLRGSYQDIEAFVDELHDCESILSTSLHGLIVSHAYGIPARWCDVPDAASGIPGDGTKFHDYMLSVGLPPEPALLLPRGTVVAAEPYAQEAQRLPAQPIDLRALAAAAPFKLRAELLEALG